MGSCATPSRIKVRLWRWFQDTACLLLYNLCNYLRVCLGFFFADILSVLLCLLLAVQSSSRYYFRVFLQMSPLPQRRRLLSVVRLRIIDVAVLLLDIFLNRF